jgi:hypothetical protein
VKIFSGKIVNDQKPLEAEERVHFDETELDPTRQVLAEIADRV